MSYLVDWVYLLPIGNLLSSQCCHLNRICRIFRITWWQCCWTEIAFQELTAMQLRSLKRHLSLHKPLRKTAEQNRCMGGIGVMRPVSPTDPSLFRSAGTISDKTEKENSFSKKHFFFIANMPKGCQTIWNLLAVCWEREQGKEQKRTGETTDLWASIWKGEKGASPICFIFWKSRLSLTRAVRKTEKKDSIRQIGIAGWLVTSSSHFLMDDDPVKSKGHPYPPSTWSI